MNKFKFENLEVWQKSKDFAKNIYSTIENFPKTEDYGLKSQLTRAAISVASNIAEGSSRTSGKDQAHFSQLAYSSLMEVTNQLIIANEINYIDNNQLEDLKGKAEVIASMLSGLRKYQLKRASK